MLTASLTVHITALDVIAPYARYKLWLKVCIQTPVYSPQADLR